MSVRRAIDAVERRGVLLVFPIANRAEPRSLWSELHPRSKMSWAWDDDADPRVVALWHLRAELARSQEVVYSKWFRGRATLFSRDVFAAMLASLRRSGDLLDLPRESRDILLLLEEDSPQSTKQLRRAAGLVGRPLEGLYVRSLRALWSRLLVVGAGEVSDGAFPSLAIGATRLVFEELWDSPGDESRLRAALEAAPLFRRELERVRAAMAQSELR